MASTSGFRHNVRARAGSLELTFRSSLQAPETLVLIAEQHDGSVVGYLLARCRATFLANGPAAWVEEVMVTKRARRQGVGQALMTEVESWAQGARVVLCGASKPEGRRYLSCPRIRGRRNLL
ncbi:GNAT family N-acetyltransferase [Arthrobacter sp. M-10]|uniref:GNAT family N-acetyltransferase n=1 Tax=unclassified Arthrobacter TaxID=235627 RepID=UPI002FCB9FE1